MESELFEVLNVTRGIGAYGVWETWTTYRAPGGWRGEVETGDALTLIVGDHRLTVTFKEVTDRMMILNLDGTGETVAFSLDDLQYREDMDVEVTKKGLARLSQKTLRRFAHAADAEAYQSDVWMDMHRNDP
jgi:hypothetical protein